MTITRRGSHLNASTRLAESIAGDLRQRILSSDLTEGPLPKQEELIAQYQVSGPSLREALRILESEGFITIRRGRLGGGYVHKPDWRSAAYAVGLTLQGQGVTMHDLADCLLTLEPMCVAACAARPDRATTVVPALHDNLERAEGSLGRGAEFTRVARTFHELFVDFVPNDTTRLSVRSLVAVWSVQEETWAAVMQESGGYPSRAEQARALKAHRRMADLVAVGDRAGTTRQVRAHLRATQRLVLQRHGDRVVDASSTAAVRAFRAL